MSEKTKPWVWHDAPPQLGKWVDGKKHELRRYDEYIVYEQNVQIGHKMTEWGTPSQSTVNDLARISAVETEDHQLMSMWECGRLAGHREGYAKAMADLRKLIGVSP